MDRRINAVKGVAILLIVAFHTMGLLPLNRIFFDAYYRLVYPQFIPNISELIPPVHSVKDVVVAVMSIIGGSGYQGVHLFIIASGLVLTLSFLEKGIKLRQWYLRRAERVLPMYWLSLFVVFMVLQGTHLYYTYVPATSPLAMVLQALGLHVFVPEFFYGLNGPLWYIGLLFQLYLVFPFLMRLFDRWSPAQIFLCSVLVTVVFRLAGIYYIDQFHPYFAFGAFFPCRLAEFVFGITFAFHIKRRSENWIGHLYKLAIPLYLCGILLHCSKPTTAISDTVIGISLFLILWRVAQRLSALALNGLDFLGRRSLGIFIFHAPILKPAYELLSQLGISNRYLIFCLIIVIATVCGIVIDMSIAETQKAVTERFAKKLSAT